MKIAWLLLGVCCLKFASAIPIPEEDDAVIQQADPDIPGTVFKTDGTPGKATTEFNSETKINDDGTANSKTISRVKTVGKVSAKVLGGTSAKDKGIEIGTSGGAHAIGHSDDSEAEGVNVTTADLDHRGAKTVKSVTGSKTRGEAEAGGEGQGYIKDKNGSVSASTKGGSKSSAKGKSDSLTKAFTKFIPEDYFDFPVPQHHHHHHNIR